MKGCHIFVQNAQEIQNGEMFPWVKNGSGKNQNF